jgi:hypothetical protein
VPSILLAGSVSTAVGPRPVLAGFSVVAVVWALVDLSLTRAARRDPGTSVAVDG